MDDLRHAALSLQSGYQATTNDVQSELNKAKEITENYDAAVKESHASSSQTQESDPDPEYAAKMAAVVEEKQLQQHQQTLSHSMLK